MEPITAVLILAGLIAGGAGGYYGRKIKSHDALEKSQKEADKIKQEAKEEAKEEVLKAKEEALKIKEEAKKEEKERRTLIAEAEKRNIEKEKTLDERTKKLDETRDRIEKNKDESENFKNELRDIRKKQLAALEKISKLTQEKAKEKLLEIVEKDYKKDVLDFIKKIEAEKKEEADKRAREILSTTIQKIAGDMTSETTVTAVTLPSDEMKGRIIGREGRNIQAIERATGCDIIVDDTPETIVISGFDPVRRHVAKRALESLLKDGRIHPTRIEEAVQKAQKEIDKEIKEAGEQAVYKTGVAGLPSDLVKVLGRLKFRTSYGQNVLQHSMECSYLAGALASELGANVNTAKKAALIHDIGKAVDQEIEGSHAAIGRDIAKKFGMDETIINAIEAHHEEVEFKSIEAILVQVADTISGGRPGARRDTLEAYIKRLEELENIANSFEGVEKSFAIQAGREVRVLVSPEELDDLKSEKLAKEIATKIEKDLKYPGQIKVNVIREKRITEFAK
ncbi:ribonuclease Y [candidate division WS5 bacterium]|uniref:Ribonuclease Y n=1 Tax=candidate division WS5 bacterium TaxID=2093353 RepID=A0A419DG30_9BACT|nr:MAG: ribonuclease Y [candidate division WS5 bacterium]